MMTTTHRLLSTLALGVAWIALRAPSAPSAHAQAPASKDESASMTDHLVPPLGSAPDVPIHFSSVCILMFPEKLSADAITSSTDYEIQPWMQDGLAVAVRAVNPKAGPATLALATASGTIKVNVTLRLVPAREPALTLIRFKPASDAEAFEARVRAEIAKRTIPLEKRAKELDAEARRLADLDMTERVLRRGDVSALRTHARNSDNVILHGVRSYVIGNTGYLTFEIENRSNQPYLLDKVRLIADKRDVAGHVRLLSTAVVNEPSLIGIVVPNTSARGIIAVPVVDTVLRRPLTLEISTPNGRGSVRLDRKLEIR